MHCDILEGTFNTENFYTFIVCTLDCMQPFPAANSVLVMDNCKTHTPSNCWAHQVLVQFSFSLHAFTNVSSVNWYNRGMCCEYLPSYSPDYNPIELVFSATKYHLRCNGAYVHFAMTELSDEEISFTLQDAIYSVSLQDVFRWHRHCGYI